MGCEVEHCDEAASVLYTLRYFLPGFDGMWGSAPITVSVRLCRSCAARCADPGLEAVTIQAEALT